MLAWWLCPGEDGDAPPDPEEDVHGHLGGEESEEGEDDALPELPSDVQGLIDVMKFDREAYLDLVEDGLAVMPDVEGAGLYYHKRTRQWHAAYPGQRGRAPTHGSLRTERKAILICLHYLWDKHVEATGEGLDQLHKLVFELDRAG